MISVDLSTLVLVYLFLFLGNLFVLWYYYNQKNRFESDDLSEKETFRCNICTHVYLKDKNEKVSKCPRCKSFN